MIYTDSPASPKRTGLLRTSLLAFAIIWVPFVLIPASAETQPTTTQKGFADLDAFIGRTLKEYRVPGAAVAIVQDGKIVFVKGYGVRDVTKPGKVDKDTIFQLASVSKTFTAAVDATLVDEGKLRWDTPIVSYLPEFAAYDPYATAHMTLRDLLAMRTGWPQFIGDQLGTFGYSRAEILRRLRYLKPAYSFRDVAQYSNLGYFTAGQVAARAGKESWNVLVKDRLLVALGMTRSGTSVRNLQEANAYTPHAIVNGVVEPTAPSVLDTTGAAGGVTSTARDMAHWLQVFLNKGIYDGKVIIKAAAITEMYKRSMVGEIGFTELPPISHTTGFYYGLGFDSFDYAGQHVIEKAGALAGVRTVMTMLPEKRSGIVVLANLNLTAFPEAVRAYYIETMLLKKSATADLAEITARNNALAKMFATPTNPTNPKPFRGELRNLVGTYENPLYGLCSIALKISALQIACGPAKYHAPLELSNNQTFVARWPGATSVGDDVTFAIGSTGLAKSFTDDALGVFTSVRHP